MGRSTLTTKTTTEVRYGDRTYTRDMCLEELFEIHHLINMESKTPKVVTRKFFRDHAEIPEAVISALFGTFLEFKRAAGMQETRAQQTLNTATARAAAADNLRKVWIDRVSYGDRYVKDSNARHKIILGCNDLHDAELDPFMRRILMDTAKRVQPDIIVSNGDHFDCPEFGKYPNDPREWDVVGRVRAGLSIFADFREAAPNAQIDLIEGNHEARIVRFFTETAPAVKAMLSDLHGIDMRKFFGLDKYEINYIAKTDMNGAYTDAAIRKEMNANYKVYYDCVCAHHFPAGRHFGMPGWNGHHHSHLVQHFYNATFGAYEWHQFGAGHRRDATYTNGQKWANGFGLIHVDSLAKQVQFEYIPVGVTMAVVGGQRYVRREDEFYDALLPMTDSSHIIPFPEETAPVSRKKK